MTKNPPSIPVNTLPGNVEYGTTSLTLANDTPFERWEEIGNALRQIDRSSRWWIGDWWAFGDHAYGERAAQVVDGESFGALANAGYVSRKFETSRRHEVLPWDYHYAVASLEPAEADRLLDKIEADRGNWNRKKLRDYVKALKAKPVNEKPESDDAESDPRDVEIANLRGAVEALTEQLEEMRAAVAIGTAPEGMDAETVLAEYQAENKRLAVENFGLKKERDSLMAETAAQQRYIGKLQRALKKAGIQL